MSPETRHSINSQENTDNQILQTNLSRAHSTVWEVQSRWTSACCRIFRVPWRTSEQPLLLFSPCRRQSTGHPGYSEHIIKFRQKGQAYNASRQHRLHTWGEAWGYGVAEKRHQCTDRKKGLKYIKKICRKLI